MSTALSPGDFSKALDLAVRSTFPAPVRAQNAWLADWKEAMERMQYLQVKRIVITESLRAMIQIRANLKKPNLSLELVKPDVTKLWKDISGGANEAAHMFIEVDAGFEYSFFAVDSNGYITGHIAISRHS